MENFRRNKMFIFLMINTICATAGLQVWRTLFDNYAVHVIGLEGSHVGMIQSIREIPGFLALLVIYVLLFIKEHRLSSLAILALGAGVAATGLFPSYAGIICTTLVMSFGFHYFETTNQSLTLQYFDEKTAPLVFGRQKSYAAASNIAAGITIFLVAPLLSYKAILLLAGFLIICTGLWGFSTHPAAPDLPRQRKRMVLRKTYWLFYFLTFMAGARRQIFIAFAVFLLVQKFGFSVKEIAALFLVNNVVNYFLSPYIGKFIVRFGERKVLSLEYASLVLVFLAYAMVESKAAAACLYIADHIFFNFAIAIKTFFQKIADPRDIAPSMAVGFTINHIAAVFLPALGGLLWMVDYRIPFVCAAAMSLVSLGAVQLIDSQLKKKARDQRASLVRAADGIASP